MSKNTLGPHGIDLSAPGGIAALLDFHRQTFGDARMDAGETSDGDGDQGESGNGDAGDAPNGFPEKTPLADMTTEQQVSYWKHQARKHEDRNRGTADYDAIKAERDELKTRTQTDAERVLEDARKEAGEVARKEARAEALPRVVRAEFKAAAAGRIPADRLDTVLEPLDLTKFLTADGSEVDTDKVTRYVEGLAPAGGQKWPDMGQGRRDSTKATGVGAGRALYEDRHTKK